MNRQQRRFMKRQKAPHQSYADVLARQREAHEAVKKAARDATVIDRHPTDVSPKQPNFGPVMRYMTCWV